MSKSAAVKSAAASSAKTPGVSVARNADELSEPRVSLRIGKLSWEGWTSVKVTQDIEKIAHEVELTLVEKWPRQNERAEIEPDAAFTLRYGKSQVVVAGHLDSVAREITAKTHIVRVKGRGIGGDLADCSVTPPWEFRQLDLLGICAQLCAPFNISVKALCEVGPVFESFAVQPGETAFVAIERACRQHKILPVMDAGNTLYLTKVGGFGEAPAPLVYGDARGNVLSGKSTESTSGKFSLINVIGQQKHGDDVNIEDASACAATVKDATVARYRPKVILAEQQASPKSLQARAEHQLAFSRGRSVALQYVTQGWFAQGEKGRDLWRPNTLVQVEDEILGARGKYLIKKCEYIKDLAGTKTSLTLSDKESFAQSKESGNNNNNNNNNKDKK